MSLVTVVSQLIGTSTILNLYSDVFIYLARQSIAIALDKRLVSYVRTSGPGCNIIRPFLYS